MSDLYPEWIQEQLDKLPPRPTRQDRADRETVRLAIIEARITYTIGARADRIETQLQQVETSLKRILAYCEGEVIDQ